MIRLLRIEWAKLATYKPFWWLSIFYLALAPGVMLFVEALNIPFFPDKGAAMVYGFPMGWNLAAYLSSWFHILLGIIIVIFATNEFSNRTARQHIIDGLSRNQFFVSKLSLVAIMSIIATVYTMLIAIMGSLIYTGGLENFSNGFEMIPIFLFQTFGYLSLAMLFSFLLRSSGYAILIFLGVLFVEAVLRSILGEFVSEWCATYAPIGMISKLTPAPYLEELISSTELKYQLTTGERFMYGSLYISVYIYWAYWLIKKRDM